MSNSDNILTFPINSLRLSDEFKIMAQQQHFRTLEDLLNWPMAILLMHEGFTYHSYEEMIRFLKYNNLSRIKEDTITSPKY